MWNRFFDKVVHDNRGFAATGEEEEDEDVVIDTDEEEEEHEEITVDLDEEDDDTPPKEKKAWAAMRKENADLKKTVDDLKTSVDSLQTPEETYTPPVTTPPTADPSDPRQWTEAQWDELAKKDWKKAVDLRSQIQAEDRITQSTQTTEFNRVLEESKTKVLHRHPELGDPNSEKSKVYRNIVTANPEYTNQKKGPLSAMYEMEDYMEKNMGYKREEIVKAELKARQDEASRHSRVQLTSTTGHNLSQGNKVVISKDEMEFCKLQGIDPKIYASNKKKLETSNKGGIQL